MTDAPVYMAALKLDGRRCLVLGGGQLALEKVEALHLCGAVVHVVAREHIQALRDLAGEGTVVLHARSYDPGDLDGCMLVVDASEDPEVAARVHRDAEERGIFLNVADVPQLCSFILPAITRAGPIAVAISTGGASPALAKRMKREAEGLFGPEYARLAEILSEQREWSKEALPDYGARKAFFESIVNGSPDPIELLRAGRENEVLNLVEAARRAAVD